MHAARRDSARWSENVHRSARIVDDMIDSAKARHALAIQCLALQTLIFVELRLSDALQRPFFHVK